MKTHRGNYKFIEGNILINLDFGTYYLLNFFSFQIERSPYDIQFVIVPLNVKCRTRSYFSLMQTPSFIYISILWPIVEFSSFTEGILDFSTWSIVSSPNEEIEFTMYISVFFLFSFWAGGEFFYWHRKKTLRHYSEEEYEQHMVQFALYGSKTEALDQKQTLFIFLVTDNNFFPLLLSS